jgi:hypothetical protein
MMATTTSNSIRVNAGGEIARDRRQERVPSGFQPRMVTLTRLANATFANDPADVISVAGGESFFDGGSSEGMAHAGFPRGRRFAVRAFANVTSGERGTGQWQSLAGCDPSLTGATRFRTDSIANRIAG